MSMKSLVRAALVASILAVPVTGWSSSTSSTTVSITETVDSFAEWDNGSGTASLTMATHITSLAAQTDSVTLHLYTNATGVAVTAAGAADGNGHSTGVLTNAGGTATLDTTYKLTGAGLASPDPAFVSTATFFAASYNLNGGISNGDYTITLNVQAQVPGGNTVPPAEAYTAAVTLTATW